MTDLEILFRKVDDTLDNLLMDRGAPKGRRSLAGGKREARSHRIGNPNEMKRALKGRRTKRANVMKKPADESPRSILAYLAAQTASARQCSSRRRKSPSCSTRCLGRR